MSEILAYVKSQDNTKTKIREDIIELRNQNIATQAKKAEELTANQVVYLEAIKMMGDDIFDLGMENETLRDKLCEYVELDEKWLKESKNKRKLTYTGAEKNSFILDRMKKQQEKFKKI